MKENLKIGDELLQDGKHYEVINIIGEEVCIKNLNSDSILVGDYDKVEYDEDGQIPQWMKYEIKKAERAPFIKEVLEINTETFNNYLLSNNAGKTNWKINEEGVLVTLDPPKNLIEFYLDEFSEYYSYDEEVLKIWTKEYENDNDVVVRIMGRLKKGEKFGF